MLISWNCTKRKIFPFSLIYSSLHLCIQEYLLYATELLSLFFFKKFWLCGLLTAAGGRFLAASRTGAPLAVVCGLSGCGKQA